MFPAGTRVERDGPVERVVGAHSGFVATPADLDLPEAELAALVARQRDVFAARGEAVEWKTRGHDRPDCMPRLLEEAGFRAEAVETVMVGAASTCAGDPMLPPGVDLVALTSLAAVQEVAAMESAIWGEDRSWLVTDVGRRVVDGTVAMVAARSGSTMVSAAWVVWVPGTAFAYLAGGATLPEWRRRGIYRALVARRAAMAVDRGVRYLAVDASEDSRPVLEGLGFVAVTTTTPYVWHPEPT